MPMNELDSKMRDAAREYVTLCDASDAAFQALVVARAAYVQVSREYDRARKDFVDLHRAWVAAKVG